MPRRHDLFGTIYRPNTLQRYQTKQRANEEEAKDRKMVQRIVEVHMETGDMGTNILVQLVSIAYLSTC